MLMWVMMSERPSRAVNHDGRLGVHTFRLVNAEQVRFVKFHWKPLKEISRWCGRRPRYLGKDPDFNRATSTRHRRGDYPDRSSAAIVEKRTAKFASLLDATKLIPRNSCPW